MSFIDDWNAMYEKVHDVKETLQLYPIEGNKEVVKLGMPLTQAVSQPAGMFSAPALFGLADLSATWLAMQQVPKGVFPLAVASSINVVSNVNSGDAISTSRIVRAGRTIIVTDTEIHSAETGKLLAKISCTYSLPPQKK
ncbi:Uncharacterized protein, possibly involved in aromatic compounds catabolism [Corynebacterium imitans]|uniref:Uncharacterized protein, possibly involved in aromatic compounds catabolism n=1 Tax=Corynebacterium imitans TaxID=156978 RepID=A0A076NMB1_9CORY|nr:PaaI family thioesterase [Corynebacterium imitans]AIJ34463.1 hypothetical protein CIMIT_11765 [Corynebacterium imitans]SNV87500.1 Uncharacterized protein, possibly involved in aromatic compounds catabolism [Corynebacterium imitans]